jgi:hypothetical protein
MLGQLKFCFCRQFYSLPAPVFIVSQVHHFVVTTNIPVKSGWTTGGEYSEEGSVKSSREMGEGLLYENFFR